MGNRGEALMGDVPKGDPLAIDGRGKKCFADRTGVHLATRRRTGVSSLDILFLPLLFGFCLANHSVSTHLVRVAVCRPAAF
jgi:hypothetical protein